MNRLLPNIGLPALTLVLLCGIAHAQSPGALTPDAVDHMIRAEWQKQKVVPAPPVDDARFLRRVYLDIAGTIPSPGVITSFLADKSPDKREKAVEALVDSPRYADHWTDYWDNVLMGRSARSQVLDRVAFRAWLHTQFEQNTPWNTFVYSLVSATGQNSTGGTYAKAYGAKSDAEPVSPEEAAKVNGAVNWTLKYAGNPQDLSGSASKIFLGVQIQCAQCHDHKTEKWKQDDFRRFTACFISARAKPIDIGKMQGRVRRVDLEDLNRPRPLRGKNVKDVKEAQLYVQAQPTALDGTDFGDSPNRRQALATWMTTPANPWLAPTLVNRLWSHFLGRGFVEPIDDFRPTNPTVLPDVLKRLSDDFVVNGYDVKHLIKLICATQVYQLSSAAAPKPDADNHLWARYRLKALAPEELMDTLVTATNLKPVLEKVAGANLDTLKFQMQRQFEFLFDVDEEFEQKEFEGTIPQALMLLNGNLVNRSVTPIPGTALAEVMAMPVADAKKVEALYLRTVSRRPTPAEAQHWVTFVNAPRDVVQDAATAEPTPRVRPIGALKQNRKMGAGGFDPLARFANRLGNSSATPKMQAYEDLFWALLNSSEFTFNH